MTTKIELQLQITENRAINGENAGVGNPNNMRVSFQGINLQGVKLDGIEAQCCDFEQANFINAVLTSANLSGCTFKLAKLSGIRSGAGAIFSAALAVPDVDAVGYGGDHTEADFSGSNFSGAFFTGANLTSAKFVGADLTGATFTNANLTGVDFTKANLTGAIFTGATLTTDTIFDWALLRGAIIANTTEPAFLDAVGVIHA